MATVDSFLPYGSAFWAARLDISDGERVRAQEMGAVITRRFVVQYSRFVAGITAKDRLEYAGVQHGIFGVKEVGNRFRLEITAGGRADRGPET